MVPVGRVWMGAAGWWSGWHLGGCLPPGLRKEGWILMPSPVPAAYSTSLLEAVLKGSRRALETHPQTLPWEGLPALWGAHSCWQESPRQHSVLSPVVWPWRRQVCCQQQPPAPQRTSPGAKELHPTSVLPSPLPGHPWRASEALREAEMGPRGSIKLHSLPPTPWDWVAILSSPCRVGSLLCVI